MRILLKLSGEFLAKPGSMFDFESITSICRKIVSLAQRGIQLAVVCGAGNIWRHRDSLDSGIDRVKSDHLGMMGGVINAVILNETINKLGGDSLIFAAHAVQVPTIAKSYNALSARSALGRGKIVLCAGGTGSPYSTHDLAAVLRALELQCDMVVKVTKVDGIYDKDPKKYPDAKRFDEITFKEVLERNLEVMDQSAIGMAKENNLPIFVCNIDQLDLLGTPDAKGTRVVG